MKTHTLRVNDEIDIKLIKKYDQNKLVQALLPHTQKFF